MDLSLGPAPASEFGLPSEMPPPTDVNPVFVSENIASESLGEEASKVESFGGEEYMNSPVYVGSGPGVVAQIPRVPHSEVKERVGVALAQTEDLAK